MSLHCVPDLEIKKLSPTASSTPCMVFFPAPAACFQVSLFQMLSFPMLFICLFVYWKILPEGTCHAFKIRQEFLLVWIHLSFLCVDKGGVRGSHSLKQLIQVEMKIHLNQILIHRYELGIVFLRGKIQEHVHGRLLSPKAEIFFFFFFKSEFCRAMQFRREG